MQDTTTQRPVADPAEYRVSLYRRSDGSLSHIDLWTPASHGTVIYRAEDVDALLARARELAVADPHDDRLPPESAIIEAALMNAGFALKGEDQQPGAQDDAEDAFFSIGREASTSVRSLAARLSCYPATAQAILEAGYWPNDEIDALVLWSFPDHSGYPIAEFPFKNLGAEPEDLPRLRPLFLRLCSNARADARTEFEQAGMRIIQQGLRALLGAGSAADVAAITEAVERMAGRN